MKKNLLIGAALFCATTAFAQKPFVINGIINGNEGKYVYLYRYENNQLMEDSCLVKEHSFKFQGSLNGEKGTGGISLNKKKMLSYSDDVAIFTMEPTEMKLAVDIYDLSKTIVIGSALQTTIDEYEGTISQESRIMRAIGSVAHESKDEAYKEQLEKIEEPFRKAYQQKTMDFVKSHPSSEYSLTLLAGLMGNITLEQAQELYNCLSDDLKTKEAAKDIADEIATRIKLQPGKPAPLFTAKDINGKKFSLAKLKGKYVVLDFWASWCGPCRASNPHMKELYAKYGSKGLDFVYVADNDNSENKWREAVKKDGIEMFHHVLRGMKVIDQEKFILDKTNDISEKYAVHYLPTKYLIDKDGNIVGKFETEELTAKLKEIFGF